ncbi:MAG: hypothetical protein J6N19_00560 [Clostridium sp.]|nr:hypothetical protein [Clostridium sp.]
MARKKEPSAFQKDCTLLMLNLNQYIAGAVSKGRKTNLDDIAAGAARVIESWGEKYGIRVQSIRVSVDPDDGRFVVEEPELYLETGNTCTFGEWAERMKEEVAYARDV